jgi:hypothetical protein
LPERNVHTAGSATDPDCSAFKKEHRVSFDLMVFDAAVAPRSRTAFIGWFEKQTQWQEWHG